MSQVRRAGAEFARTLAKLMGGRALADAAAAALDAPKKRELEALVRGA